MGLFPQERVNNAIPMMIFPLKMVIHFQNALAAGTPRKTGTAIYCLEMTNGSKSEITSLNTSQQQEIPAIQTPAGSLATPQSYIIDGCALN